MNFRKLALAGLMLGAALTATAGVELVGLSPYANESYGQSADTGSGPAWTVSFVAPSSSIVEAIRWWGFHGADSGGPSFDNFTVALDGVVQAGSLSVTAVSPYFDEYTLDIVDVALTATNLSIINDSLDVQWFWQSAQALGNPDAPDAQAVAFSLIGRADDGNNVPEPSTGTAVLAGLAALALTRRALNRSQR